MRGANPPIVGFYPGDRETGIPKDAARNVRATQEFVVNLVDQELAEPMTRTASSLPYGQDELKQAGLTTRPSSVVRPPRIAESPASLECTESGTIPIGHSRLITGLVKRVHGRDDLIDPGTRRINSALFRPVGRMASPDWYGRTNDRFERRRPE